MLDFGFGKKHDVMRNPGLSFLLKVLQNYNWRMGVYFQCPLLTRLRVEKIAQILRQGQKMQRKWEDWSGAFTASILDQPNTELNGRFAAFLDSRGPATEGRIPFEELWAEGSVWMLAGTHWNSVIIST